MNSSPRNPRVFKISIARRSCSLSRATRSNSSRVNSSCGGSLYRERSCVIDFFSLNRVAVSTRVTLNCILSQVRQSAMTELGDKLIGGPLLMIWVTVAYHRHHAVTFKNNFEFIRFQIIFFRPNFFNRQCAGLLFHSGLNFNSVTVITQYRQLISFFYAVFLLKTSSMSSEGKS